MAGSQVQRFSPLSPWQEAWRCAGRPGAGEGAESSASGSTGSRRGQWHTGGLAWASETSKPAPRDTLPLTMPYLLQQGHTFQWCPFLWTYGAISFQLPQCIQIQSSFCHLPCSTIPKVIDATIEPGFLSFTCLHSSLETSREHSPSGYLFPLFNRFASALCRNQLLWLWRN